MEHLRPRGEGSQGGREQAASSLTAALLGPQSRQTRVSDDDRGPYVGVDLSSSGERDADLASTTAMMPERSSIGSAAAAGFMVGSPW